MPGILHKKCDASALVHTCHPHKLDLAQLIVDDGNGMDADDIEETLRQIARRLPASTA